MNSRTAPPPTRPTVVFTMDQIAGHVTNYRNLRAVVDLDGRIESEWKTLEYYRESGWIERACHAVRIPHGYAAGVTRGALEMRRGLAATTPDVIFTNASVSLFFTKTFRRTPTLYDFDSTPLQLDAMESYTPKADPRPLARLKFRMQRQLFRDATLLQAWSEWARQSVIDDYGIDDDKIVVNPPGIDLTAWVDQMRRHPTDDGRPARVLFVGGDFERKGGHDLLAWYAGRPAGAAPIEIDVVTREPVDERPGVIVHHDIEPNSAELLALYAHADVFVLPSHGECFGISTIEAMASGLPVIQTAVGGVGDIIVPGDNGYIVEPESPASLGEAIDAVLDDPSRWASMGRRSRQLAVERFDARTNGRITVDHLLALAEPRH